MIVLGNYDEHSLERGSEEGKAHFGGSLTGSSRTGRDKGDYGMRPTSIGPDKGPARLHLVTLTDSSHTWDDNIVIYFEMERIKWDEWWRREKEKFVDLGKREELGIWEGMEVCKFKGKLNLIGTKNILVVSFLIKKKNSGRIYLLMV